MQKYIKTLYFLIFLYINTLNNPKKLILNKKLFKKKQHFSDKNK